MNAGKAHETVNIDALVLENERLRSNVEYLETHYRRLEAFINGAPFAIAIKNRDRHYAEINPALEQQFGLETDDILWHSDFELVGTPWGAPVARIRRQSLAWTNRGIPRHTPQGLRRASTLPGGALSIC